MWTAHSTGDYTFWLAGLNDTFDTQLAIYTGNVVGSLTLVAANDDLPDGSAYSSMVAFCATEGVKYRIAMDTYNPKRRS